MIKRQVFFSFEYYKDVWRAAQVRSMGKVSGDSTFSDNDWEEVKTKDDASIRKWINDQLEKELREQRIKLYAEEFTFRESTTTEFENLKRVFYKLRSAQ